MSAKILVIIKSSAARKKITSVLELSEYEVATATTGKEGIEMARANPPDLVLCDAILPGLDGLATLHMIENIPEMASVPFILINAKWDKRDFRKAMEMGADDYLPSPFDDDDLLKVVSLRLKKRESTRNSFGQRLDNANSIHSKIKSLFDLNAIKDKQMVVKLTRKGKLYTEGSLIRFVYFVLSGKIKTFKTNEQGQNLITGIYKQGDFFGYIDMLDGHHHNESAVAMEDSALAEISREDILQLLFYDEEVSSRFIGLLTDEIAEAKTRLLQVAYSSVRRKTADALIYLAKKYRDEKLDHISIPANRDNLSSIAGISPESISRNLTDFRKEKLIETINGTIKILNLEKLETITG